MNLKKKLYFYELNKWNLKKNKNEKHEIIVNFFFKIIISDIMYS
jgi:hypothetical protein